MHARVIINIGYGHGICWRYSLYATNVSPVHVLVLILLLGNLLAMSVALLECCSHI